MGEPSAVGTGTPQSERGVKDEYGTPQSERGVREECGVSMVHLNLRGGKLFDKNLPAAFDLQPIIAARDGRDLQIPPGIEKSFLGLKILPGRFRVRGRDLAETKIFRPPNPSRRERQLSAVSICATHSLTSWY